MAIGGSNALAGLSSGFVQSGGASQTMAAEDAGGKSPLTALFAAGLILLTGAFLAPLFEDLPQATLGAIVVVAVSGFVDFGELGRLARIRRSAIGLALVALAGVLVLGVLKGLLVAAGLSLLIVLRRLSRPTVAVLGRDPHSGRWGNVARNPDWDETPGVLVAGSEGPLFYANSVLLKDRVHALLDAADPPARSSCSTCPGARISTSRSTRSPSWRPSCSATASTCGWRPSGARPWRCCGAQGSPTACASSPRSPRPPPKRRACQP